MISRIASRAILALKGQVKFVLGVVAITVVVSVASIGYADFRHGHSILDRLHTTPTQASSDCARRVITLVTGHLEDVAGGYQCFATSTRYAQMGQDTFEQFVRRAAPPQATDFVEVGRVPGEDSGTSMVVFAIRDGDPDTIATIYLDNEGKVTRVGI